MTLLSLFGCGKKPDPALQLESIFFGATHGYHAYSNIGYKAERMDSGKTRVIVEVGDDRDRVFETDGSLMDTLEMLVREYRMDRFSGNYQPDMEILDGDSWSMEICFSNGAFSSCSGYMAYPPGKGAEAIGKVESILSRWLYQEPAEEVALVSYRYELHSGEGTEIFAFSLKDTTYSLFAQPFSKAEGQQYTTPDDFIAIQLARFIRWNHLGSYTGENRAEEDKSRPRWIMTAEYENGQTIEAMDYLDRSTEDNWRKGVPSFTEMGIRIDTERAFDEAIQRIANNDR